MLRDKTERHIVLKAAKNNPKQKKFPGSEMCNFISDKDM